LSFFNYLLTIQYKGTAYLGWQVQEKQGKTVQGELNKALRKISKSEEINSIASGRTDAGVHAFGQKCKVRIPLEIPAVNLIKALNSFLPDDIRIIEAENCEEAFHPIRDSLWKEYWYCFSTEESGAMSHEWMAHYSFELDFDQMQKACQLFVGSHDFCNFFCVGSETATTIREIFECELIQQKQQGQPFAQFSSDHWCFRVRGSGFLKQMVRLMVGVLWEVGRGKVTLEQLSDALINPCPNKLGAVAPACGLYLYKVTYPA
jgi:tRNA pseudouridine38-40 synthase